MIKFSLDCDNGHSFDGWFSSSKDFDDQQEKGLVSCPVCNCEKITKSLMAPSVSTSRKKDAQREKMAVATVNQAQAEIMTKMREIRDEVIKNADDVGDKFPEEARKIHYGEAKSRGIYGEANKEDVKELLEEGVSIAPLPILPEDAN